MEKTIPNDSGSSDTAATLASAPFNNPHTDLTIHTSDNVEFRVEKLILCGASPFFANMFSLLSPAPVKSSTPVEVIDVSEPSVIWDRLLRITYALPPPMPIAYDQLWPLFEAAQKYDIPGAHWALGQVLASIPYTSEENTLRAYILAYKFGFPEIAAAATRASLAQPHEVYVPELRLASSAVHFRWTEYRRACVDAAATFARNKGLFYHSEWWDKIEGWGYAQCHSPSQPELHPGHPGPACPPSHTYNARLGGTYVRRSLGEYMERSEAVLQLCPVGTTVCDPQLVAALVQDALTCPQCAPNVRSGRIAEFVEFYAKKMDEAVAKIQLNLE